MARYSGLDPQKYDRIREAAIRLFYRQSIEKTTIDQIAKESGVAKGTVYLYFPSREKLIEEVFWYCHKRAADTGDYGLELLPTACDKLKRRVENLIRWERDHPEESYIQSLYYTAHPFSNDGKTSLVLHYNSQRRIIEEGIRQGEFKPLPLSMLGELINSSAAGVITYMARYPELMADRTLLDTALESILSGLRV